MYFRKLSVVFKTNANCLLNIPWVWYLSLGIFLLQSLPSGIFNNALRCYVGIQDVYGKYLINVPDVYSKTITYAGAKIIYKHQSTKYKDVLEIRGPTNEALRVVVGY